MCSKLEISGARRRAACAFESRVPESVVVLRRDSKSLVPAVAPFTSTSILYLPAGHPSGFAIWNSVLASPVGAIVCVDSFTICPSWYVQRAFTVVDGAAPSVATDA